MKSDRFGQSEAQALKRRVMPMLKQVQLNTEAEDSDIPLNYQKLATLLAQEKVTPEEHRVLILSGVLFDID